MSGLGVDGYTAYTCTEVLARHPLPTNTPAVGKEWI